MGFKVIKASKWTKPAPKCVFCDIPTETTIILYVDDKTIRGWRCPHCGFSLIHPTEIPKAMKLLRKAMKLSI